jgi:hypothetical protein
MKNIFVPETMAGPGFIWGRNFKFLFPLPFYPSSLSRNPESIKGIMAQCLYAGHASAVKV